MIERARRGCNYLRDVEKEGVVCAALGDEDLKQQDEEPT